MRVDGECGLACVVRAARRRIDDLTLVSGAAPLRAGLERGVRCPFWDLSRLSFTRPMIFPSFSPGIASPLLVPCPAQTDPVEGKPPVLMIGRDMRQCLAL